MGEFMTSDWFLNKKRIKLHRYLNIPFIDLDDNIHPIELRFSTLLLALTGQYDDEPIDYIVKRMYQSLYRHNDISNIFLQYYQTVLNFIEPIRENRQLQEIFQDYFQKVEIDRKDVHFIIKLITELKLEKYTTRFEESNTVIPRITFQ